MKKYDYVPFSKARHVLHVMVDSGCLATTYLELSHWPGNRTPDRLKADTSVEIVFKYLEATPEELPADHYHVCNDHYDLDGLLSIWIMTEPEKALAHRALIEAVAITDDFERFTTEDAAKVSLSFKEIENLVVQDIYDRAKSTDEFTELLIAGLLPHIERCLFEPEHNRDEWDAEYQFLMESNKTIASSEVSVTDYDDIGLCVIETGKPLHRFSVNAATRQSLILLSQNSKFIEAFYKYESFVETVSYQPVKRISWKDFVTDMNSKTEGGTWFMESPYTAHPSLRFYPAQGDGARIETGDIVPAIMTYLKDGLATPVDVAQWYETQSDVLPPSYKEEGGA